jgi:hypothetical protein
MTETPKAAKPFSLADIKAQVANEDTFDFEPLLPSLEPSGIVLKLKSDLAPSVDARLKDLIDANARKQQLMAAQAEKARPGEAPMSTVEDMSNFGRKLIAVRVAGWNMPDEFTEANVMALLRYWDGLGNQILAKTAEAARFTPASPTA